MTDKELITRINSFFDKHMGAFINYPTDIGELNIILMELEKRVRQYNKERVV